MIEIHEKFDGLIYQLRIPMVVPPNHVYSYIVRDGGECVIIDAGYPDEGIVYSLVNAMGRIPNCRLSTLVITHMHIDHYGMASELRRRLGVSIVMHANDYEQLMKLSDTELIIREFKELLNEWGVPPSEEQLLTKVLESFSRRRVGIGDLKPEVLISGEEYVIGKLRIVLTPGHSPGHVSAILHERGVAFTGDLILPTITTHVGLSPINPGNPLLDYIKSLIKVRNMRLNCVFPGHEGELCNVDSRIKELINHRASRLCEALIITRRRPQSIFDVANSLRWLNDRDYASLDPLNRYLALTETAALMRYLESVGAVRLNEQVKYEAINDTPCSAQSLLLTEGLYN